MQDFGGEISKKIKQQDEPMVLFHDNYGLQIS
jgi:hypothetical protein